MGKIGLPWLPAALALLFLTGLTAPAALAAEDPAIKTTARQVAAKARPDECYRGLGNNIPFMYPTEESPCSGGSVPKVNQGYVWALADIGHEVWFGTVANPHCQTAGLFGEVPAPYETGSWACEFGYGPFSSFPYNLPASIGDFRAPQIFVYDKDNETLTELTPMDPQASNEWGIHDRVVLTSGFRAAGQLGDLMLLAGSSLDGGVNVFAFDSSSHTFLGVRKLEKYKKIRSFVPLNGALYSPMGNVDGSGSVLKWSGTVSPPPCDSCFAFEEVGALPSPGASIAEHEGRLYAMTWPSYDGADPTNERLAGLVMSPPVPAGGLTAADNESWTTVWDVGEFEPDPLLAQSYGGGALMSFDGYLFFGTMHVPLLSTVVFYDAYGIPDSAPEQMDIFLKTFRTAAIFRGRDLDNETRRQVDLLYGNPRLWTYDNATASWQQMPNKTGRPKRGYAGFSNPWNNYTWSMAVWDNRLWVGMMDWSYMAVERGELIAEEYGSLLMPEMIVNQEYGGDLYYFPCADCWAYPESRAGVDNYANYGVRTMAASDNESLFLGMANPMNLMTDPYDDIPEEGEGGWELIRLAPWERNTDNGTHVVVELENGVIVTFYKVVRPGVTVSTSVPNPFASGEMDIWEQLLGDNNTFYSGGPQKPEGSAPAEELLLMYSSAEWNAVEAGPLAEICVPANGLCNPRLYQLQFDGDNYLWQNISDNTTQADQERVCGEIEKGFLGVMAVFYRQCTDNGLFCDGAEICGGDGLCESVNPPCDRACDEDTDLCVDCLTDGDCNGGYCDGGTCIGCRSDADCGDGDLCTTDVCAAGFVCRNVAIAGCCETDSDCAADESCSGGFCAEKQTASPGAQAVAPELSVPATISIDETAKAFGFEIRQVSSSTESLGWSIGDVLYDSNDGSWIAGIEPRGGTADAGRPALVTVTLATTALLPGVYSARIPVSSNGGNRNVAVVLTVSETTTTVSPLPDECLIDAGCDDGIFCNGAERCADGKCLPGEAPCDSGQVCIESAGQCRWTHRVQAFSLQSRLRRPGLRSSRCTRLVLRTALENNFKVTDSTVSLIGPGSDASGVTIDSDRGVQKAREFILVPICVEKTATPGRWRIEIRTNVPDAEAPFVEVMEFGFEVI